MKRTSPDADGARRSTADRQPQHRSRDSATNRGRPIETLHRRVGNQAVQALHERGELQAKLEVSSPGDSTEREAERVADEVMRTEGSNEETDVGADPDIQRSAPQGVSGGSLTGDAEEKVRSSLGSGKPLPESTRSSFGSRFGRDFSDVRVHTDSAADGAARSIDAQAFTLGTDVAFARGKYDPGTSSGEKLLAHELTHVVQQTGIDQPRGRIQRQNDDSTETQSDGALEELREALGGGFLGFGGPDAEEILQILREASAEEKAAILEDASLMNGLQSSLSRGEMLQALRILDADASTKLKTAMDGWGADEGEILAILRGASAAEKTAVLDDSSLMNALESSLSRDKMLQALALLGADASTRLRAAMDGWGADEGQILQILQGASAAEKTAILGDSSLMNALESSLSRSSMIVALDHLDAHPKKKLETATDGWGVDGQEVLDIVRNASNQEKNEILSDAAFLRDPLKRELSWNEFAMAVELLGRDAPTGNDLQSNNTVVGALNTAWNASNPGNPNRGANPQEQGGWIYLDIITDTVQTESAGGGSQSSISLSNPSTVTDSIVVGNYHTHPNTGPNWQASPSPQDKQNAPQRGVPGLVRAVRNQIFPYGPNRRAHLAGSRGYPGPGGGIAPQARLDDEGNIVEDDE